MRFKTEGVCAIYVDYEIDEKGCVHDVKFIGGCPGSLQAIAKLVEGKPKDEVIAILEGVDCRNNTSCADQFAQALKKH